MSQQDVQSYLDDMAASTTKSGGKRPAGVIENIELFKTPDDGNYMFFPLPHADAIAANNYMACHFARTFEVYCDLTGERSLYMAPGNFGMHDPVAAAFPDSLKYKKNDECNEYEKALRNRLRTQSKVLMWVADNQDLTPKLWIMGQQTFTDKILPAIRSPVVMGAGINPCDPTCGMWFQGSTEGKARNKRIQAVTPAVGQGVPLWGDPGVPNMEAINTTLSGVVQLEKCLLMLSEEELNQWLVRATESVKLQHSVAPGTVAGQPAQAPMGQPPANMGPVGQPAANTPMGATPAVNTQPQQQSQAPTNNVPAGGGAPLPPGVDATQPIPGQAPGGTPEGAQPSTPVSPPPPQEGQQGVNAPTQTQVPNAGVPYNGQYTQPQTQQPQGVPGQVPQSVQQPQPGQVPQQQPQTQQPQQQQADTMAPTPNGAAPAEPNFGQAITPGELQNTQGPVGR